LGLLDQGKEVALDARAQVVRWALLGEQPPPSSELRDPVLEDRLNQVVLGTEVVADGGVVGVSGLKGDLAQRHPSYPPLGEKPLGGHHQLLLRRRSDQRPRCAQVLPARRRRALTADLTGWLWASARDAPPVTMNGRR